MENIIIIVLFLSLVLLLHLYAFTNVIYKIFKYRIKFNMIWVWIIFIPLIGPFIYFSKKHKGLRASKFMLILLMNLSAGYTAFSCVNDSIESFNVSGGFFLIQLPEQVQQSLERDTVRTKEEKNAEYKLAILYWSHLDYDGQKATYKLSKTDFLSKGKDIAASDYDNIISNVDWLNSLLNNKDTQKLYEKSLTDAIKTWQKEAEKNGLK